MNQFHGIFFSCSDSIILLFMENNNKKIREIDLFDFTSFFGMDFLKFSGPLWHTATAAK